MHHAVQLDPGQLWLPNYKPQSKNSIHVPGMLRGPWCGVEGGCKEEWRGVPLQIARLEELKGAFDTDVRQYIRAGSQTLA
jgi:hypothetical protein